MLKLLIVLPTLINGSAIPTMNTTKTATRTYVRTLLLLGMIVTRNGPDGRKIGVPVDAVGGTGGGDEGVGGGDDPDPIPASGSLALNESALLTTRCGEREPFLRSGRTFL